jgi:hypothetical protein
MILFDLQCAKKHVFESWFKDGAAYERQAKRGLVTCPYCGSAKVEKALMAPRLAGTKKSRKKTPAAAADAAASPVAVAANPATEKAAELHRQLAQLRQHIETNFDPVGDKFAEEARKIHYGEAEQRNIYGRTTDEEAQELAEEGVEFAPVPWLPDKNA